MLLIYLASLETPEERTKLEEIYTAYKGLMLSRAYDYLKDRELAQDAVHDAILKLSKNLHKIEEISCHKTKRYVVVVTESVCSNLYHKQKNSNLVSLDAMAIEPADTADLEDESLNRMQAEQVARLIAALPGTYRLALSLKYLEGYSDREIADALGISNAAVRKRLERGRQMVADQMNRGKDDGA